MKKQLEEGVDFYFEKGLMVLTEQFHIDKGFCCGSGCRHCPYQYEKVPEPFRTALLEKKKSRDSK